MKRRFLRAASLLLCLVMLVSCFTSCEKDAPEENVETGELANPFDAVYPFDSISITELVKDPAGNYVKSKLKNAYDGERFVSMLRECKFFDDSTNIDSVELSYLIEIDGLSFFVSTDLSHIYVSRSKENKLMQRDVIAYRVEGFGGMEWDVALKLRDEATGFMKELIYTFGLDVIAENATISRGVVSSKDNAEILYDLLAACEYTEIESQGDECYRYYCTLFDRCFKLSDDLGGYRYMCDVTEVERAGEPISVVEDKTYRIEGFDDKSFEELVAKREHSVFRSLHYLAPKTEYEGEVQIYQSKGMRRIYEEAQVSKIRSILEQCSFLPVAPYKNGDMDSNGYYISGMLRAYDIYIAPTFDKLIVLPTAHCLSREAMVYNITGFDIFPFNNLVIGQKYEGSSFEFWNISEENFG